MSTSRLPDGHRANLKLLLPEYQHVLVFRGVTILLATDCCIPVENLLALREDVTEMEVVSEPLGNMLDGSLVYLTATYPSAKYLPRSKTLVVRGPLELFGKGRSLAYIAQFLAECIRATKSGVLLVHAAAVRLPSHDISFVILGEKGAGKTTLAFRLCHQHRFQLIGNDQVFLGQLDGGLVTEGGNAWFNVRQTAVLADECLRRAVAWPVTGNEPTWNNKRQVDPREIGVGVFGGPSRVGAIFDVRIDHYQRELHVADWTGVQRNLLLHERFGRHLSGQATPFQDDEGRYLGSLPMISPDRVLKARDELVRGVIRAGITQIFAPSAAAAAEYVANRARQ